MYNHLLPHNKSEWNYLILDHKKSNTFLELFLIKKSKAQNMIYTTSGAVKYVGKIVWTSSTAIRIRSSIELTIPCVLPKTCLTNKKEVWIRGNSKGTPHMCIMQHLLFKIPNKIYKIFLPTYNLPGMLEVKNADYTTKRIPKIYSQHPSPPHSTYAQITFRKGNIWLECILFSYFTSVPSIP